MSFESLNLSVPINKAIKDLGFINPSEIQEKALPILKEYRGDFVGQAQTGTGKTAAFVIPLLEQINFESKEIQSLILAPTRELANQIYQEVENFGKYMPLKATTVYGGVSYDKQIKAIKGDRPQIIVGTPGRVIDLINRGVLKLGQCHKLVIDEADEMLNMGFLEDVETIMKSLTKNKKIWMFSATIPTSIKKLIDKNFKNPKIITVEKKTLSNEDIEQYYSVFNRKNMNRALKVFIESFENCYGIVFCETRQQTKDLTEYLIDNGLSVVALHGDLNQVSRDKAMKRFKDRKSDIMVCTDVAARGIDVNNVTHVFNMSLPRAKESYVHRIGRTGRAGATGKSISLITPGEVRSLKQIEKLTGKRVEKLDLPSEKELKKSKILQSLKKLEHVKEAMLEKKDDFKIDSSFEIYQDFFDDLSKEETLKILFSSIFKAEFVQITALNESIKAEAKLDKKSSGSRNRKSASKSHGNGGSSFRRRRRSSGSSKSASRTGQMRRKKF